MIGGGFLPPPCHQLRILFGLAKGIIFLVRPQLWFCFGWFNLGYVWVSSFPCLPCKVITSYGHMRYFLMDLFSIVQQLDMDEGIDTSRLYKLVLPLHSSVIDHDSVGETRWTKLGQIAGLHWAIVTFSWMGPNLATSKRNTKPSPNSYILK